MNDNRRKYGKNFITSKKRRNKKMGAAKTVTTPNFLSNVVYLLGWR